jgi:hypothetical protein
MISKEESTRWSPMESLVVSEVVALPREIRGAVLCSASAVQSAKLQRVPGGSGTF